MLTPKQHELLLMIWERLEESGVPPSFDEMKDALGLKSKSGIHRLITGLEERGFIRRLAHRARAIEVIRLPNAAVAGRQYREGNDQEGSGSDTSISGSSALGISNVVTFPSTQRQFSKLRTIGDTTLVSLPLYGKIAAGTPIEALRDNSAFIDVPSQLLGRGEYYALEVEGDSMMEAGILDGDTVIIEKTLVARNNDIVVALVDEGEVTLKHIVYDNDEVILIPANRSYQARRLPAERVQVQGRLVSLLRRY